LSVGLDEKQAHAVEALFSGSHGNCEVIGLASSSDPLFFAVDDVVIANPHRGGADVRDVAAGVRLAHREGHHGLAGDDGSRDSSDDLRPARSEHGRQGDAERLEARPQNSTATATSELVHQDQVVEGVKSAGRGRASVLSRPRRAVNASSIGFPVQLVREASILVPFADEGQELLVDERPHLLGSIRLTSVSVDRGERVAVLIVTLRTRDSPSL